MRTIKSAFTMIEILVVVAILGVIAVTAVPIVFSGQDDVRVTAATQMLMSDLLYLQNDAITRQHKTYVFFLNGAPPRAYTAAYFTGAGSVTAPSWADVTSASSTFGTSGNFVTQPSTKSKYRVEYHDLADGSSGPLGRCKIKTVSNTSFGFDTLGQPVDTSGTALSSPVTITITNVKGELSTTVTVAPITGEISVSRP